LWGAKFNTDKEKEGLFFWVKDTPLLGEDELIVLIKGGRR